MKFCKNCKKYLSKSQFYPVKTNKDKLDTRCKHCVQTRRRIIYYSNLTEARKSARKRTAKYRTKVKHTKIYKIKTSISDKKKRIKLLKRYPWFNSYKGAKERCNNSNNKDYQYYGGRGIKFLMTKEDFKFLWFRDKAWLLKQPSIDRKDNAGNYCLNNCRFIEKNLNSKLRWIHPNLN